MTGFILACTKSPRTLHRARAFQLVKEHFGDFFARVDQVTLAWSLADSNR